MPMQFRCGSCQQLLGIAKRKAGSVVQCPTCAAKTLVPHTADEVVKAPVRRNPTQPQSIFDRMDVDKLLQKPSKPQLVEDSAVAVAPPPVRRKMVFTPDPLADTPAPSNGEEEPQAMPRFDVEAPEPVTDEPFALTPIPTLTPHRKIIAGMGLPIYLAVGALFVAGAFFAGHWIGAHRPLF